MCDVVTDEIVLLKVKDDSTERSGRIIINSASCIGGPRLKSEISTWRPAVLTEVIRCFTQFLQEHAWTVS